MYTGWLTTLYIIRYKCLNVFLNLNENEQHLRSNFQKGGYSPKLKIKLCWIEIQISKGPKIRKNSISGPL